MVLYFKHNSYPVLKTKVDAWKSLQNTIPLLIVKLISTFQVLKVAILAEKYATDYKWYVDVILNLIRLAGDYVSEEVKDILKIAKE